MAHRPKPSPNSQSSSDGDVLSSTDIITSAESASLEARSGAHYRLEEDLLGTLKVPADAYYGIHTLRAVDNFQISRTNINHIPELIRGMVMVKKAAAMANMQIGRAHV